jgi:small subunit ribosomal protein S9
VTEEQTPQGAASPTAATPSETTIPPVVAPPTTPTTPAAAATTPAKPVPGGQRKDWTKATPGGFHWGTGRRKTAVARVRIRPGSGEFKVNKRDADVHFRREVDRRAIRAPLEATEMLKKLDVFVNISGGGTTGQAGAIILGIARALYHYDSQYEQVLRDGGYLTRDSRRVERKKYGQSGARKRFQFSKR